MYKINRSAAIIKPKQPYVDWANSLPQNQVKLTLNDFKSDCTTILIPDYDTDEEALEFIKEIYSELFDIELAMEIRDKKQWPKKRTLKTFLEWFNIEFNSIVLEPFKEKIEKENFINI